MRERRQKLVFHTVCFFGVTTRGLGADQKLFTLFFDAFAFEELADLPADPAESRE